MPLSALTLPLSVDWYFDLTLNLASTPIEEAFGTLDDGGAFAELGIAAGTLPVSLLTVRFDHACVVFDLPAAVVELVSNPVSLRFVP